MYATFWWQMGSLSWLDNYHEVLMTVYDLVVAEEKLCAAEVGRKFDEGIFLV